MIALLRYWPDPCLKCIKGPFFSGFLLKLKMRNSILQELGFHDVCRVQLLDQPRLPNTIHIRPGKLSKQMFLLLPI